MRFNPTVSLANGMLTVVRFSAHLKGSARQRFELQVSFHLSKTFMRGSNNLPHCPVLPMSGRRNGALPLPTLTAILVTQEIIVCIIAEVLGNHSTLVIQRSSC